MRGRQLLFVQSTANAILTPRPALPLPLPPPPPHTRTTPLLTAATFGLQIVF